MKHHNLKIPHRTRRPPRERFSGFTLIEMLVVVAIIILLAALMVPTVSGSMNRASRVKAMSNFRQIGTIILTYSVENMGQLPGPLYTNQRSGYRNSLPLGIGAKLWEQMGISERILLPRGRFGSGAVEGIPFPATGISPNRFMANNGSFYFLTDMWKHFPLSNYRLI